MKHRLLIVEDEAGMARQLKWGLGDAYEIALAGDAAQARELLARQAPDAVLLDLGLPPHTDSAEVGLELLQEIASRPEEVKVIVTTGNTDKGNALKAVELGAYDYYQKPVDMEELRIILSRAVHLQCLERELAGLRSDASHESCFDGMIASSPPMLQLLDLARRVARTDYPVLITGESGTGKERLARAIHRLSERTEKPLVIVDCGAIPENLLESELFGHEKGSFTGAHARQIGKFERARGGTVILDEIGELPLSLQVKLLRFLQEGTVERVGGKGSFQVDTRVVAVTNVDLDQAVSRDAFREDLYYRLNVVPLKVPPLRERRDDIPVLARYYLDLYAKDTGRRFRGFTATAMDAMLNFVWSGNVRDLQNRIRRAAVMAEGSFLDPEDLGLTSPTNEPRTLREAREAAEVAAVMHALARHNGNITRAAQDLDISRPTLHDLIKKHGFSPKG